MASAYAPAMIRSWLRGEVDGLVSLTSDDAEQLLPMVTHILFDALLQLVSRDELEGQLDEWLDIRRTRMQRLNGLDRLPLRQRHRLAFTRLSLTVLIEELRERNA